MKHLLLYLITLLAICFSVNAEMVHRESKNEFKGTTSHYIKSKMVAPNKPPIKAMPKRLRNRMPAESAISQRRMPMSAAVLRFG